MLIHLALGQTSKQIFENVFDLVTYYVLTAHYGPGAGLGAGKASMSKLRLSCLIAAALATPKPLKEIFKRI